jgi:hypothetical protein
VPAGKLALKLRQRSLGKLARAVITRVC